MNDDLQDKLENSLLKGIRKDIDRCFERIEELERWKKVAIDKNIQDINKIKELEVRIEGCIERTRIQFMTTRVNKTPHKCPVCEGKGLVFLMYSITDTHQALCQPCEGKGVIWG